MHCLHTWSDEKEISKVEKVLRNFQKKVLVREPKEEKIHLEEEDEPEKKLKCKEEMEVKTVKKKKEQVVSSEEEDKICLKIVGRSIIELYKKQYY